MESYTPQLGPLLPELKNAYDRKNTDDDDCCHDNYDGDYGVFYDNDDKNE